MEVILDCPLGNKCEYIKDNVSHHCIWYIKVVGKHPQSEETVEDWGCAMAWLPIMMVEIAQTNRGQTQAICSMRDETNKRQDIFNGMALRNLQLKNNDEEVQKIPEGKK